jgi:hypothetical protein
LGVEGCTQQGGDKHCDTPADEHLKQELPIHAKPAAAFTQSHTNFCANLMSNMKETAALLRLVKEAMKLTLDHS